jgi:hypothetical protein
MELSESDEIHVEGAEDFDQVGQGEAVANQVKSTRANITLRDPDAVKAIQNSWELRRRNAGRSIKSRFLTTAQPGQEQGGPFGQPGILFWNNLLNEAEQEARRAGVEQVRRFLLSLPRIGDEFRAFLNQTDTDQLFNEVIAPLRFETGADDIAGIEAKIRDRLVLLGEQFQVPATDAEKALDPILLAIWRVATTESDRRLNRALLLRTFEKATQITVSRTLVLDQSRLARIEDVLTRLALTEAGALPVVMQHALANAPPLIPRYLERAALQEQISQVLDASGVAVLTGSRQNGKTMTALGVPSRSGRPWLWLDLSTRSEAAAIDLIRNATGELSGREDYGGVILDALPRSDEAPVAMGFALSSLRSTIRSVGGRLIITTYHELPIALRQAADLSDEAFVPIPPLTEAEVLHFLLQEGCPPEDADTWARILWLSTGGEPALVHARIAALQAAEFRAPLVEDILGRTPEVNAIRRDMRRIATETLSPDTLELLARLSLGGHIFDRELVFRIAAAEPALELPGVAIDRLAGPWLQDIGGERYRLSPLLFSLGVDVHGEPWAQNMHGTIGRAMLDVATLTTSTAAEALFHGCMATDERVITAVLSAMFSADPDAWDSFASSADFFRSMWVGEATRPEAFSTRARSLIRLAQIRIAIVKRGVVSEAIMDAFEEEFPRESPDAEIRQTRFLGFSEILTRSRRALEIDSAVDYAAEWATLAEEFVPESMARDAYGALQGDRAGIDPLAAIGFLLLAAVTTPKSLNQFIDSLERREPGFAQRMLAHAAHDRTLAHGFVQQIWLPFVRANATDFSEVLTAMRRAFEYMATLELPVLADVFGEAVVRVMIDFSKETTGALREAEAMLARLPEVFMPDLRAAQAQAALASDDPSRALAIWAEVLPAREWDGVELTPAGDYRRAATVEIQRGNHIEGARWLEEAANRLDPETNLLWKIAFGIDASFAYWQGTDIARSLTALKDTVDLLVRLEVDPSDMRQFMVLKRIGHTLMCMAHLGQLGEGFEMPIPAMSSNFDTDIPDGLPVPPPTPIDAIIAHAVRFEYLLGGDGEIGAAYEPGLLRTNIHMVRVYAAATAIFRAASAGATRGVVRLIVDFDSAMADFSESLGSSAAPSSRPFGPPIIQWMLILCSIVTGLNGVLTGEVLMGWREEASQTGVLDTLRTVFDALDGLFGDGSIDSTAAMQGAHGDSQLQTLGAVRYAATKQVSIEGWLRIHALLAGFLLPYPEHQLTGAFFIRLVEDRWRRNALQRFALSNPRVTAPALEAAVALPGRPWQRIRAILRAAEYAAATSLPQSVRGPLDDIGA